MIDHLTPCRVPKDVYTDGTHIFFWNGVYSSWYTAHIEIDGYTYNCCEQYFMLKKAVVFGDRIAAEKIWNANDPREQKRLGRTVRNYNDRVWSAVSRDFMFRAHWAKFTQHSHLRDLLCEHGSETIMVEASPFDKLWGIGRAVQETDIVDTSLWGKNWLGLILTEIKGNLCE